MSAWVCSYTNQRLFYCCQVHAPLRPGHCLVTQMTSNNCFWEQSSPHCNLSSCLLHTMILIITQCWQNAYSQTDALVIGMDLASVGQNNSSLLAMVLGIGLTITFANCHSRLHSQKHHRVDSAVTWVKVHKTATTFLLVVGRECLCPSSCKRC